MDAARHLAEFLDHARQTISEAADLFPDVLQAGRNPAFGGAQLEDQCDQLLLRSVVEITLDAPTAFVAGRNDAGPGSGDFVAHRGVRNGSRHELREPREMLLRARGNSLARPAAGDHEAPDAAVDQD